jgi:hypothetical protein
MIKQTQEKRYQNELFKEKTRVVESEEAQD